MRKTAIVLTIFGLDCMVELQAEKPRYEAGWYSPLGVFSLDCMVEEDSYCPQVFGLDCMVELSLGMKQVGILPSFQSGLHG